VSTTKSAFLSFKNHLKASNPKKALKQAKNDINAQNAIRPGFESMHTPRLDQYFGCFLIYEVA
jgi:hypothetical protein